MQFPVEANQMIGLRDAQRILKIGRNTMHDLVESGRIPAKRVGKEWQILGKYLLSWMEEATGQNQPMVNVQRSYLVTTQYQQKMISDWT
ncbi:helix-turn-helix domain-containing protein [candidate division KSB1 bacterium]|nr:helix-turn-helix domain-containing protein [candidate division KSB1 bacterium]